VAKQYSPGGKLNKILVAAAAAFIALLSMKLPREGQNNKLRRI
jgi:hypothetical protein